MKESGSHVEVKTEENSFEYQSKEEEVEEFVRGEMK